MYFLNINKSKGITSFDVIRFLRKKLQVKQIGHSGTLDPLAIGVMQVAVGAATRLLDYLPSDKEYVADIKFGYTTETLDAEAEEEFVAKPNFSREDLKNVLDCFVGKTLQIPPKYSAIKINGKKMCDLARNNNDDEIKISPREIEIYSIDLLEFNSDFTAKIKVFCAKGTYIRSLVRDIGDKLGCGAYMTELTRIKAGVFDLKNSNSLDEDLIQINPIEALLIPVYELNDAEYQKIKNGNAISNSRTIESEDILLTKDNKLVSIAKIIDNQIKPKKVF